MERIYKKVSVESLRNRTISAMGYIPYNGVDTDDSWGNFLLDIQTGATEDERYRTKDLLHIYNLMLEQIRDGIKLKNKADLSNCSSEVYSNVFVHDDKYDFLPTTDYQGPVYEFGIYSVDDFNNDDEEYTPKSALTSNFEHIVLVDDIDTFSGNSIGTGTTFLKYVYNNVISRNSGSLTPYFEIPIFLTQNIADIGILTTYEEEGILPDNIASAYTYEEVGGVSWDTKYSNEPNPLSATTNAQFSAYTTNSKLKMLMVRDIMADDNGKLLPGVFVKDGHMWRYTYSDGKWSHTNSPAGTGKTCGDGLSNADCVNTNLYRTATIDQTVNAMLSGETTGVYYFYVKYKNDENNLMEIPYKRLEDGYVFNKFTDENDNTCGDFIISSAVTESGNVKYITFEYVLGGEYNGTSYVPNTGIRYVETYKYDENVSGLTCLDDFEDLQIFYNNIDYDFSKETIYNSDLMLYRSGNTANVTAYTVGDVWRDGVAINAPVFKEDYLMGINGDIKMDIDVEIDRGNAAAFERHLKLSECNSFEDLYNYGNNYYNL